MSAARSCALRVRLIVRPAQDRAHARGQLPRAEGLGHVVVRAQLQAEHALVLLHLGGEDDDGRVGLLAIDAHELVAAHLRHHQVEDDQVGLFLAGDVDRLLPVRGGDDAEALLSQIGGNQFANFAFVINHQECLGHSLAFYGRESASSICRSTLPYGRSRSTPALPASPPVAPKRSAPVRRRDVSRLQEGCSETVKSLEGLCMDTARGRASRPRGSPHDKIGRSMSRRTDRRYPCDRHADCCFSASTTRTEIHAADRQSDGRSQPHETAGATRGRCGTRLLPLRVRLLREAGRAALDATLVRGAGWTAAGGAHGGRTAAHGVD